MNGTAAPMGQPSRWRLLQLVFEYTFRNSAGQVPKTCVVTPPPQLAVACSCKLCCSTARLVVAAAESWIQGNGRDGDRWFKVPPRPLPLANAATWATEQHKGVRDKQLGASVMMPAAHEVLVQVKWGHHGRCPGRQCERPPCVYMYC